MDPEIFLSDPVHGSVILTYGSGSMRPINSGFKSYLDIFVAVGKKYVFNYVVNYYKLSKTELFFKFSLNLEDLDPDPARISNSEITDPDPGCLLISNLPEPGPQNWKNVTRLSSPESPVILKYC